MPAGHRLPELRAWAALYGIVQAQARASSRLLPFTKTGGRACVVAPTRALVAQWYGQLADAFGADRVGAW